METEQELDCSTNPIYRRAVDDTRHRIAKDLEDVIKIQCSNGNWNYDSYMHGLANGLLLAKSVIKNEEPIFLRAPNKWLKDYPTLWTRIKLFFKWYNPVSTEQGNTICR